MTKPPSPEPHEHRWSSAARFVADVLLLASGAVNIVVRTYKAYAVGPAEAAVPLAAGLLLLFAGTIDRFESLKGWGIEAKVKQLDRKLVESEELLTKLRRLTELVGKSVVQANASQGRREDSPKIERSYHMAREVRSLLLDVGVSTEAVEAPLSPWSRAIAFDLVNLLRQDIRAESSNRRATLEAQLNLLQSDLSHSEEKQRIGVLMQSLFRTEVDTVHLALLPDRGAREAAEVLREIQKRYKGIDPEFDGTIDEIISPWLPELDHLAEKGDLRLPDRWFDFFKAKG